MKKVSIIVPIYNVEAFLSDCLDSIFNQTYRNIEIVLVDDGSTDRSSDFVEKYASIYPKTVKTVTKKNGGLNNARRDGFLASTGDFIAFVDSDDIIAPRYIELLKKNIDEFNADMAMCGHFTFENDYDFDKFEYGTIESNYEKDNEKLLRWLIVGGAPWNENRFFMTAWGSLVSRNLLEKIDWNFSDYRANEDEFWSMQVFKNMQNGLVSVNTPMYGYRNNPQSITTKKYKNNINGRPINKFEFIEHLYVTSLDYLGNEYDDVLKTRIFNTVADFVDIFVDRRILTVRDIVSAQHIITKYGKYISSTEVSSRVKRKIARMIKWGVVGYVLHRRIKQGWRGIIEVHDK